MAGLIKAAIDTPWGMLARSAGRVNRPTTEKIKKTKKDYDNPLTIAVTHVIMLS